MSTTYIAMILAILMGTGLLAGIAILSLLSGALNFLFVKPKIIFLKSTKGETGFAFSFEWDQDAEPAKFDRLRLRLFNPFGKPTQIDVSREFDGSEVDFARDLDLGESFKSLFSATGLDKATIEIEVSASKNGVTHLQKMSALKFLAQRNEATLTVDNVAAKYVVSKEKVRVSIPERTFISPPLPKTAKQLKMATNPIFAGEFAGASAGGVAAPVAANYAVSKVWIEPGCIVCDACEAIAPLVFEVTDTTCVIRSGAPLDDGLKIQDAAEACPVEVIKFIKV